jgi:predicted thioesterase
VRPGLRPGIEAQVTITVTGEMVAHFEELGLVHPVYATWFMVKHMELASRKVILPYLEAHEEAVGHSVPVTHRAPTPVGATVTARARLTAVDGNQIVCEVSVHHGHRVVGDGMTIQVVVPAETLRARFVDIGARRPDPSGGA